MVSFFQRSEEIVREGDAEGNELLGETFIEGIGGTLRIVYCWLVLIVPQVTRTDKSVTAVVATS